MDTCISEEVMQATTECRKKFLCLDGGHGKLCKVEATLIGRIHFVKCLSQNDCPYKEEYGNASACACPVRKELYNKYEI
jgi:hypothetical protein